MSGDDYQGKQYGSEIRTIFFDVGGVLLIDFIDDKIVDIARKYDRDPKRLLAARKEYRTLADKGHISDREFWEAIFKTAAISPTQEDREVDSYMEEIEGVRDIAEKLKRRSYHLAILSNDSREMFMKRRQRFALDRLFENIILSSEHGFIKPYPEIYRVALEITKTPPEKALLIDDRQENIKTAQELGMQGILFLNAAQLREELYRSGIDFP